jgi:hypothetical protein
MSEGKAYSGSCRTLYHGDLLLPENGSSCILMTIMGTLRGSIKERWFSSVIQCMNGPLAAPDEGLSYVAADDFGKEKFTLRDAVTELGHNLIGQTLFKTYGTWPVYAKFFDYDTPLFHHLHLDFAAAARIGRLGKPESYYFPLQLNNHMGRFPVTYFGFDPDVTRAEVKRRLEMYLTGDNRITELSRAYRIELGTGWYTPPGVIHAPGSVLTYEPQWNSDVNSVYENITSNEIYSYDFLAENCPEDKKLDLDYVMSLLDWEKNVDPHYKQTYFRPKVLASCDVGYEENWISYANDFVGAKELIIFPGSKAMIRDEAVYGCIVIQGQGRFGVFDTEAACLLRFSQMSGDEFFVSEAAARTGVLIENHSKWEPMVILKHFGPNHPDMPKTVDKYQHVQGRAAL